jgi:uncharacterized repeat protein (TIGR01451 family)
VLAATTGFSVGNFTDCSVTDCLDTSTTSLTVNASATALTLSGNNFTGTITNSAASTSSCFVTDVTTIPISSTGQTATPVIARGKNYNHIAITGAFGAGTLTIAAHSTSTVSKGDMLFLTVSNKNSGTITITWNAQYTDPDGSAISSPTSLNTNAANYHWFIWNGSAWVTAMVVSQAAI